MNGGTEVCVMLLLPHHAHELQPTVGDSTFVVRSCMMSPDLLVKTLAKKRKGCRLVDPFSMQGYAEDMILKHLVTLVKDAC